MEQAGQQHRIVPVILCGGSGTRLWPISREDYPKQFLKILGDRSLLQQTVLRALKLSACKPEDMMTVTLEAMAPLVFRQYDEMDRNLSKHVLREPSARNTAAAVASAALYAAENMGEDVILWVLPSDHHVGRADRLGAALADAAAAAAQGNLVTFGIQPSRPETGYGYIRAGQAMESAGAARRLDQFVEKPDFDTALEYLNSGAYLWNSGMFVFRVGDVLEAFRRHSPDILNLAAQAMQGGGKLDADIYATIPARPFDVAIMEKNECSAVVPVDPAWSDIGSWQSLWETEKQDADGNVLRGDVATMDCEDIIVHSDTGRLIACAGLKDIVIADTGDALMVVSKSDAQAVKQIVDLLKRNRRAETKSFASVSVQKEKRAS